MVLVIFAFPILTVTLAMLVAGSHTRHALLYFRLWRQPNDVRQPHLGVGTPGSLYLILAGFWRFFGSGGDIFAETTVWLHFDGLGIWAITFLSFIVWLHHFFTMGAGANVNAFFGIMTMIIAVPTGVKVFNWLFTMYRGRISFTTPMLWFMGFVVTFTIGGVAGVLMSVPAIDFQVHNSLFLVAHFHTMIIGGVCLVFAGFTYWFPKFRL